MVIACIMYTHTFTVMVRLGGEKGFWGVLSVSGFNSQSHVFNLQCIDARTTQS